MIELIYGRRGSKLAHCDSEVEDRNPQKVFVVPTLITVAIVVVAVSVAVTTITLALTECVVWIEGIEGIDGIEGIKRVEGIQRIEGAQKRSSCWDSHQFLEI